MNRWKDGTAVPGVPTAPPALAPPPPPPPPTEEELEAVAATEINKPPVFPWPPSPCGCDCGCATNPLVVPGRLAPLDPRLDVFLEAAAEADAEVDAVLETAADPGALMSPGAEDGIEIVEAEAETVEALLRASWSSSSNPSPKSDFEAFWCLEWKDVEEGVGGE